MTGNFSAKKNFQMRLTCECAAALAAACPSTRRQSGGLLCPSCFHPEGQNTHMYQLPATGQSAERKKAGKGGFTHITKLIY